MVFSVCLLLVVTIVSAGVSEKEIQYIKDNIASELFPQMYSNCVVNKKISDCHYILDNSEALELGNTKKLFSDNRKEIKARLENEWELLQWGDIDLNMGDVLKYLKLDDSLQLASFFILGSDSSAPVSGLVEIARNTNDPKLEFFKHLMKPGEKLHHLLVTYVVKNSCNKIVDSLAFEHHEHLTKAVTNVKGVLQYAAELCVDPENAPTTNKIERRDTCVVCQEYLREAVVNGKRVVCPPCGDERHSLCNECWLTWAEDRKICPTCRGVDLMHLEPILL